MGFCEARFVVNPQAAVLNSLPVCPINGSGTDFEVCEAVFPPEPEMVNDIDGVADWIFRKLMEHARLKS